MSDPTKFGLGDLTVTTFTEADWPLKNSFEALVRTLTPELDDENGPDTWQWVLDQNASFATSGLYTTFLFLDRTTGELLATGSFVPDDRDALKNAGIAALGVFGFVNVLKRKLRHGHGVGKTVLQFLDDHVQNYVNFLGTPQDVYLFTLDPGPYQAWGFEATGQQVPFLDHEEPLCKKTYVNG